MRDDISTPSSSERDSGQLLYELQLHQIELEAQNEELHQAQRALETSRERYFDLYDLAPIGYLTISRLGLILEANLTAATLLGLDRGKLESQPFTRFIDPRDQDIHYLSGKKLAESGQAQEYELRARNNDGVAFWVNLAITMDVDSDGDVVRRIMMSDISDRKRLENELLKTNETLVSVNGELQDMNATLRILLNQRGKEHQELQENVLANMQVLIVPYLERIRQETPTPAVEMHLAAIIRNIEDVTSSFSYTMKSKYLTLTSKEIRVADLIRSGLASKDIAGMLNVSIRTAEYYRKRIREKLGLTGKKTNLCNYLGMLSKADVPG